MESSRWTKHGGEINTSLTLKSFNECVTVINKIAIVAERVNHHPEICIRGYKNLDIKISTHEKDDKDTNSLTEKDIQLADEIDNILKELY